MTYSLIFILTVFGINSSFGQSMKARFLLRVLPDNGWNLQFNKDNTYRYYVWNGIAASDATLDSGKYVLNDTVVELFSVIADSLRSPLSPKYFLTDIKIKKYEFLGYKPRIKKFSLTGERYLVLTRTPFDRSTVVSLRPQDRIEKFEVDDPITLRQWVEKIRMPSYGVPLGTMPEIYWTTILLSESLQVAIVDNDQDIREVFYRIENQVFVTPFYKLKKQHRAVTKELRRNGYLTKSQERQALESIERKLKKKEITTYNTNHEK